MDILYFIIWIVGGLSLYIVIGYLITSPRRRERKNLTFADFRREFSDGEYSEKAISDSYADMVEAVGYHVKRNDEIEKTLGIDEADFDPIFEKRLADKGIDPRGDLPLSDMLPIWTVEDYVAYFDAIDREKSNGRGD